MNKKLLIWLICLAFLMTMLSGCHRGEEEEGSSDYGFSLVEESSEQKSEGKEESSGDDSEEELGGDTDEASHVETQLEEIYYVSPDEYEDFNADTIPAFAGYTYAVIHDNIPYFTDEEIEEALEGPYEDYSDLDELDRCGRAMASLSRELMPTESRGDIYWIHPSGWQKNSGYERSHLIAFQLAGENDNELNLVTGTHFFNNDGMRPFEEMVGDYVREYNAMVLYRVTPIFADDELVCRGALMEGWSLEDGGDDICFCVFIYNVFDPSEHTLIDYQTGETYEGDLEIAVSEGLAGGITEANTSDKGDGEVHLYIVNKRSNVFHYPDCSGVEKMSDRNKMEFTGTREEAIEAGYYPCPQCNP
ncbi:MAG: DNA/RNA non-specific endonuclease [Firmicutes bacterium]|nr:DNA/RNA non-specific endonuclease [Bacillota bacterium]